MTASSKKAYTLADLADALLDAHHYEDAAEELRNYFVPRGAAFRQAFGMADEREDSDRSERKRQLGHLLESTLGSMLSFHSPISGYLEAPREAIKFAARFSEDIDRASAKLQRVLRTMLMALLEELVTTGRTTVTAGDLEAHGFDPTKEAPDPDDFW